MNKKIIFGSLIIAITTILLILILLIMNEWEDGKKSDEIIYFSKDIQEVEIINGTNGNKDITKEPDDLDEVLSILKDSKFIAVINLEDVVGYKWRIIVKTDNKKIDIIGGKNVTYGNKEIMFSDHKDYNRLEVCISSLFKKYATNGLD